MPMKVKMVSVSKLHDERSGVCLGNTSATLSAYLSKAEKERYAAAMRKINKKITLNRDDLKVFDKVDAITFEHHGMCLKDSIVTKARVKAAKKNGIRFVDRDGLVEHMNCMLPGQNSNESKASFQDALGQFFIDRLGKDVPFNLQTVINKLNWGKDLDLKDLNFLSDLELIATKELGWTIINPELKLAIDVACKKLGIYFQNLQMTTTRH
jgi:hypothetical protein